MNKRWIYHLSRRADWERAKLSGSYPGSAEDTADGFLHFSTASQVVESARKHRAGETGLVLLAIHPTQAFELERDVANILHYKFNSIEI